MITFTLKESPAVPVEAEVISPDVCATLSIDAIRALPVFHGKRQCRVDDFFEVQHSPGSTHETDHLLIRGDARKVKWVGRGMTRGRIHIVGNIGMHLGSQMRGGEIHATGDVGDWAGAEMRGGLLRIDGNAGGQVGAAYRGSLAGMRGGTIVIGGTAGLEVGMRMKRGTIAIHGKVRDFVGLQMKGGTIILLKGAEIRAGAWMTRGTILSLVPLPLLPTFTPACDYQPAFLRLYARYLQTLGIAIPTEAHLGNYRRYCGDTSVPGKGEILVWIPNSE